jgi:hypothetical protein
MVTAPLIAKNLPVELALVVKVMLVLAIMFPRKVVKVPMVAELPICQYTLVPRPPPLIKTCDPLAVVRVVPIWKMKIALGSPPSLRLSVVVNWADVSKQ